MAASAPRKAAPRKRSAAVAARAEVGTQPPIKVPFRGATFEVPRARISSARFLLTQKTGEIHSILFEMIGPKDAGEFIGLCKDGESIYTVATEFLSAFNKAAGSPNS